MKIFFALITTCAVFALLRAQAPGFGSGDISSVVGNRNYIERQIDCVLSRSPCDDVGRNLITALPEVIGRNCRSCSPQQAANARVLLRLVRTNYPQDYNSIVARYG
ncbi:ejaculatory bulb-specific protein 3 [Periplaneta americana]|uniref:ejaculatory bulb-specific protein 3 n=1 Tax=Periplaneta americana TaxID=6978 RepID=UPI0037E7F6A6